jgi:hypothetical protein
MMRGIDRIVLLLGVLLRLYLALVNAEANDDHLTVIRIIADDHRLPGLREAWEGFQPKLYHASVALLWDLSPWRTFIVRVRIAQLVSCAAGIATLIVIYGALIRRNLSRQIRTLTFSLVALNPTLIGLNAQATNDSFVILFGALSIVGASQFFRSGTLRDFLLMTMSVVFAALSKGNGLVLFGAITAAWAYGVVRGHVGSGLLRDRRLPSMAAFVGIVAISVTALGSYVANWKDTGNPFAINGDRAPLPHFFERTYVYRPGVTSIADSYFTFRLVDMLQHPAVSNDLAVYPLHRTSLWSQLYGRAQNVHFAQHPPSWKNTTPLVATTTRLILLLGLLPMAFVIAGMLRTVIAPLTKGGLRQTGSLGEKTGDAMLAIVAWGFTAFIILYSLSYRDFSTMKTEFLFPGLLAYVLLFATESERVEQAYRSWHTLRAAVRCAYVLLLSLYVTDVAILAYQLTSRG